LKKCGNNGTDCHTPMEECPSGRRKNNNNNNSNNSNNSNNNNKTNKSTAPVPLSPELRFPLVKCSGTALELLFIPQSAALTRAGCIQDRFSIVSSLLLPSLFIHCCCWPPGAALQLLPNCPSVALPAPELHRNCTGTAPELHRNCFLSSKFDCIRFFFFFFFELTSLDGCDGDSRK